MMANPTTAVAILKAPELALDTNPDLLKSMAMCVHHNRVSSSDVLSYLPLHETYCQSAEEDALHKSLAGYLSARQSQKSGEVLQVFGHESRVKLIPRPVTQEKELDPSRGVLTIMVVVRETGSEGKINDDNTEGEELEKERKEARKKLIDGFQRAFKVTKEFLVEKGWTGCALEFAVDHSICGRTPRWVNDWTKFDGEKDSE